MLKLIFLFLAANLLLFSATSQADIYYWRDANGVKRFSDTCPTGVNCKVVKGKGVQSQEATGTSTTSGSTTSSPTTSTSTTSTSTTSSPTTSTSTTSTSTTSSPTTSTSTTSGTSTSISTTTSRPSYSTGVGFFIGTDNKLYDANGVAFTIKGVNRVHYDDSSGTVIPKTKSNAERWRLYWGNGTTVPQFVAQFTNENYNNSIVAIPGIWNTAAAYGGVKVTCDATTGTLTHAVDEWVGQAADWKPIEKWSIINIANEWGPANSTVWRDSYITAISRMRAAGYLGTLLIDAGGCGEDAADIINYGQAVFNSDPQKNILFSIHIYYNVQAGKAASYLSALAATKLPIIVGEFGPGRNIGPAPTNLTPGELIAAANANNMGWIAWAWDDNNLNGGLSDDNWFALAYNPGIYNSSSDLTIFGKDVVENATYGIKNTAVAATIFR
jgi:mannan endo-1,4-beta-mannosidase